MANTIIIYTTCDSQENAKQIAQTLIEKKLAACVQINPDIESFYIWENKVCHDQELQVSIKTLKSNYAKVEKTIKELHSYTVPQIIAVDIVAGSQEYCMWIENIVDV